MKYLYLMILLSIFMYGNSQNYMFKNLNFKQTVFKHADGKTYADSVFFYFTFDKKYLRKKEFNGRVSFRYGFICDTFYTVNYAKIINIPTEPEPFYQLSNANKSDILETIDNYNFTLKVCIKELMIPEVNYVFFKASRGKKYYEKYWNTAPKDEDIYIGTVDIETYYKYIEKIKD